MEDGISVPPAHRGRNKAKKKCVPLTPPAQIPPLYQVKPVLIMIVHLLFCAGASVSQSVCTALGWVCHLNILPVDLFRNNTIKKKKLYSTATGACAVISRASAPRPFPALQRAQLSERTAAAVVTFPQGQGARNAEKRQ